MSEKVYQEFYCHECDGYIRLGISTALNHGFWFECPNCSHKHQRVIRDGQIFENGRFQNEPKFEIVVPKSAYAKESMTAKMKELTSMQRRDGVVIENRSFMNDRWAEVACRERGDL